MKSEFKHLAPYLPYGLRFVYEHPVYSVGPIPDIERFETAEGTMDLKNIERVISFQCPLLLRPLSDLTKEIEINGEKFVPMDILLDTYLNNKKPSHHKYYYEISPNFISCSHPSTAEVMMFSLCNMGDNSYWVIEKLFEWHFDVFGLNE